MLLGVACHRDHRILIYRTDNQIGVFESLVVDNLAHGLKIVCSVVEVNVRLYAIHSQTVCCKQYTLIEVDVVLRVSLANSHRKHQSYICTLSMCQCTELKLLYILLYRQRIYNG